MAYAEYPTKIIDKIEKVLHNKRILMVKVLWQHQTLEEATWVVEDDMQDKFLELS